MLGHLLWLASAEVVKVESTTRPDLIRSFDAATFNAINHGKASATVDLRDKGQVAAPIALIRKADFVIESSRVRALRHFVIHADVLVRETPGLV